MQALVKIRQLARTACWFTASEVEHPDRREVAAAIRSALAKGLAYHEGYRKVGGRPVSVYVSRIVDTTAEFSDEHWLRLARQYVRFHMANKAREGFRTQDVIATTLKLGGPQPTRVGLWRRAIMNEGLVETDGRWHPEPCCDGCAEGAG